VASVRLEIAGKAGSISLLAFIGAMQNELKILSDLDSALSGEPKGTLDWVVTDLALGSLVVEAESRSRLEDRNIGPEVAEAFVSGLYQLENEGTTPPYLSDVGMQSAKRLLKMIGNDGTSGLVVSTPFRKVELSAKASANIDQLLPARYQSVGSIEGKMEMISIHGAPRFIVYLARTHKAVKCTFDRDRWLDKVKDALGHRVYVSGIVHSNSRGEPLRVEIDDIRRLRKQEELPTITEIGGIDPEFTGDMSTDEYLRSIRVG
jgi:hypothetical protein